MKIIPFLKSSISSFIIFTLMFSTFGKIGTVFSASGAIWTTSGSCGTPQNVNHYASGSIIYLNGNNFDSNTSYGWQIADPGNNGTVHLSGNITTNSSGTFCFAAGTLLSGGPYQAKIDNVKGDNFSIDNPTATPTPTIEPTIEPTITPTASPSSTPIIEATNTPTPTPIDSGATATPSATPEVLSFTTTNEDVCANIDGIQTSIPNDYHLDASGLNCVQFSQPGGDNGSGTGDGGQVLGASTISNAESSTNSKKTGQVLGASTMAGTGTDFQLMVLLYIVGGIAISSGVGILSFSKETAQL